jgi:hypothetical protein
MEARQKKAGHAGGRIISCSLYTLVSVLLFISVSIAADNVTFKALIQMGKNAEVQGRISVSGRNYRLEVQRDAQPMVLIVDDKKNQTLRLDPQQKSFFPMATRSKVSLKLNPIEVFRLTSGFYPQQSDGQEIINGLKCLKINYLSNGKAIMAAWFANDVFLPIKVVHYRFQEMNFELRDIQNSQVEQDLLAVPLNYQQAISETDTRPKPTEWSVKPNMPQTISLPEGKSFKLVVSDDAADGMTTRGQMVFHRQAPPPMDLFKAPLKLPNGKSFDLAYPGTALIKSIEFHISQGGIQVKKVQPK